MKKILIIIFFLPVLASAANFNFEVDPSSPGVGELLEATLTLTSRDEVVNALSGKIEYDKTFLTLESITEANSIVPVWVERPALRNGLVNFSGIIPGGWSGDKSLVLKLYFRSLREGKANITLRDPELYRNDGSGTPIAIGEAALNIDIVAEGRGIILDEDRVSPQPFNLVLARDESIFEGRYFLAFDTTDKESGISHFEVRESWFLKGGNWQEARSPYEVKDKTLMKKVYVKAVDQEGNERVESLALPRRPIFYGLLVIILIALCTPLALRSYKGL